MPRVLNCRVNVGGGGGLKRSPESQILSGMQLFCGQIPEVLE